jgi:hypothetical protein
VPGFAAVKAAAMAHGALGSSLSGAGRACSRGSRPKREARAAAPAMQSAFADAGFDSRAYVSPVAGPRAEVSRRSAQRSRAFTLNHAAYSAGRNNSVSTVATIKPPMIATAIGPKNAERVSGIIAEHRRERRQHDRAEAPHRRFDDRVPAVVAVRDVLFDLVDQDHRVAHDHAGQRDRAEHRDEAERHAEHQQEQGHADQPERRGEHHHRRAREAAQLQHQQRHHDEQEQRQPALIEFCPRAESSTVPPVSSR